MHRNDNSIFLLYIEPKKEEKLSTPINDELTQLLEMALLRAEKGAADYQNKMDNNPVVKMSLKNHNREKMLELQKNGYFSKNVMYRGFHQTDCGKLSSCCDYRLENGMITNSLAPFYLRWYRNSISENDMNKILKLKKFYGKR